MLPYQGLEKAINEAEVQRLGDRVSVGDLLQRYPNRRGTAAIRRLLAKGLRGRTRSTLEDLFIAFCRRERLPEPQRNVHVEGYECDCVWHEARLVVELDARSTHDTTLRFETDRVRDRVLDLAGWDVIRVTRAMLDHEAETPRT